MTSSLPTLFKSGRRVLVQTCHIRYMAWWGTCGVPAAWQLYEGLAWRGRLYLALDPSHLEHLRCCSEGLKCYQCAVTGVEWELFESYHKMHFMVKGSFFLSYDTDTAGFLRISWANKAMQQPLVSTQPFWHTCPISPNKAWDKKWYLYTVLVTDT